MACLLWKLSCSTLCQKLRLLCQQVERKTSHNLHSNFCRYKCHSGKLTQKHHPNKWDLYCICLSLDNTLYAGKQGSNRWTYAPVTKHTYCNRFGTGSQMEGDCSLRCLTLWKSGLQRKVSGLGLQTRPCVPARQAEQCPVVPINMQPEGSAPSWVWCVS